MENERPKNEMLSAIGSVCLVAAALLAVGAVGFLLVTSMHDIGMMMLGNMRSGYEQYLYQHLLQGH